MTDPEAPLDLDPGGFVGLVSDTHGLLRTETLEALRGAAWIVHAGDVGRPEILDELRELAPVSAVRGNVDHGAWAERLPETTELAIGDRWLHARHIVDEIDLDPATAGFDVVVFGHSHRPLVEERKGVLFVNPGSAGPRRFKLPVTVARLRLGEDGFEAEIVDLFRV